MTTCNQSCPPCRSRVLTLLSSRRKSVPGLRHYDVTTEWAEQPFTACHWTIVAGIFARATSAPLIIINDNALPGTRREGDGTLIRVKAPLWDKEGNKVSMFLRFSCHSHQGWKIIPVLIFCGYWIDFEMCKYWHFIKSHFYWFSGRSDSNSKNCRILLFWC